MFSKFRRSNFHAVKPHLNVWRTPRLRMSELLHHLQDISSHNRVHAGADGSDKTIMETDKLLLKKQRSFVPISQFGHKFEWNQEVDRPSVPHWTSMLNYWPGSCSYIFFQTWSEVEIKPAKIHFFVIFSIIHVSKDVQVIGPANAEDGSSISQQWCSW